MVLGARLPYLSCLQRLVLHRINQTPFSNPKSLSSSKTKHSHSLDGDCDDFLPWLEQKAKTEISSVLSIGKSALGRALFASKFIRTGDCILKVPYTQLAPDNLVPEIKSLLSNKVSKVAIVAIVILVERRMGKNSEWAPYITRLPHSNEMHNPIFWSELELEMIHQSSLYQETINHKCLIEEEFLAVRPVFERFPEIFERITCEDFMHVHALVTSRSWGSAKGASLIPFADFLNHDETSKAFVLNDDENQFSEVPNELRSIGLALYLSIFGVGNFLSSFLISAIENITGGAGHDSWFSNDLNRAHLDYFYWLLAGVSVVEFAAYWYFAKSYIYNKSATV